MKVNYQVGMLQIKKKVQYTYGFKPYFTLKRIVFHKIKPPSSAITQSIAGGREPDHFPQTCKYFYKLTSPDGIGILNGEEDDRSELFGPGRGITEVEFDRFDKRTPYNNAENFGEGMEW